MPAVFKHTLGFHSNSQNKEYNSKSQKFEYHNAIYLYKIIRSMFSEIVTFVKKPSILF